MLFLLGVLLLSLLINWNTFYNGFVWDDRAAIISNADVTQKSRIETLLRNDFWGTRITEKESHKSYRPLTVLSFRLNHAMHGLSAAGFHIANVVIYLLSILCLSNFMHDWVTPSTARITTLLFAIHPCHTEAVASVVGRADSLAGVFYFLALYMYSLCMRKKQWTSFLYFVTAHIAAVLAMLSKETGLTAIAAFVCLEVLGLIKANEKELACNHGVPRVMLCILRRLPWKRCAVNLLLLCGLFGARVYLNGTHTLYAWTVTENHISLLPKKQRWLSYAQTHFWYLMKLLYPRYLCFDYGFSCIPTVSAFADARNVLPFAAYIALAALALHAVVCLRLPHLLGIALLLLPLTPALNIAFPIGSVLAERLLFIPSSGACLIFAEFICSDCAWIFAHTKRRLGVQSASLLQLVYLAPLLVAFAYKTVSRNADWRDERTLYSRALDVCPDSIRALTNFGVFQLADRNYTEALRLTERSIRLYPNQSSAQMNAAIALQRLNMHTKSFLHFQRSIDLDSRSGKAWGYLGISLFEWSKRLESNHQDIVIRRALESIERGASRNFLPPSVLHTRGSIAIALKQYPEAVHYLRLAIERNHALLGITDIPRADMIDPSKTYNQLGIAFQEFGDFLNAEQAYEMGLRHSPHSVEIWSNLGNLFRFRGNYDAARDAYRRCITNCAPDHLPIVYNNMGLLELDTGHFEAALQLFEKALSLADDNVPAGVYADVATITTNLLKARAKLRF